MADNTQLNIGTGGDVISTDELGGGVKVQRVKVQFGTDGVATDVNATDRLPVADQHTQPLTDTQLRATPVPVSGPLTDGQLRATPVPVSGPLTDGQLRATPVPVSGPLTDAQLRASDVPIRVDTYSYPISTNNSSTAQLAAGATFTGAWETPQDLPSVSILLTSDQPITLTLQQAINSDGTGRVPDIVFYVTASAGFARSLTINGNFVRLTAQNTGASTTTTFNLNVAYGNLGDADNSGVKPVTELPLLLTGAAAQTAIVNNILEPVSGATGTNVSGFRAAAVQVVSTASAGTFIFEQSNDGTNWVALPVFNAALVTGVPITAAITATASAIIYTFPLRCTFLRLRIATTITGGSIRAFTRISTEPWTAAAQLVASNTAANMLTQVSGTVTANIGTGAIAAGTNAIGDVGVQYRANATGAGTVTNLNCPATPAAQNVKSGAGRLLGFYLVNTNASLRWLKVFNIVAPTLASSTATMRVPLPTNQPVFVNFEGGMGFSTGITFAISSTGSLTDATGAVTLDDVTGFAVWI